VQISSVSAEDLKEAQRNPADHMDLMVRVTGYSGIFVDMPEKLQNNIIERTKYNG
jgi:formate C-acetyltransferase